MAKRTPMDDEGKARIMSAAARNPGSDTAQDGGSTGERSRPLTGTPTKKRTTRISGGMARRPQDSETDLE